MNNKVDNHIIIGPSSHHHQSFIIIEGILRGVFQKLNPLCGRNLIENGS